MDYNTIALTSLIALSFLAIGLLLGSAAAQNDFKRSRREHIRAIKLWQAEFDNLQSQLSLADHSAESWMAEAKRLGYKSTSVDV